jgi:meso-butanediol dehydrogenase/(S,S)-butanediol dehydrogenase/diacetyl reductase
VSNTTDVAFDFSGKVVLVTGGASGIGLAITEDFVAAGATVVMTGRTQPRLEAATRMLGDRAVGIAGDIGDPLHVANLVDEIVDRFGRLDIVVSNAASFIPGDISDISDDEWEQLRRTNIDGFFYLARTALPELEKTAGSFIATSSVSGLAGDWGSAIYNASKGAVSLFVRALALDWGARGVRVNAVAPSVTNTEPLAGVTSNKSLLAHFEARIPLGRIAEPGDISSVVLFLASDAARYVTGVVLPVDGGTSAATGQGRPPAA